jgi:hypothetical protein
MQTKKVEYHCHKEMRRKGSGDFVTVDFSRVGLLTPRPTPNLEDTIELNVIYP